MSAIAVIAGLGNPGRQYAGTRHNAGALFVHALAEHLRVELGPERRLQALSAQVELDTGVRLRLLVPTTYMNVSGDPLAGYLRFYRIPASGLLVAHDEIDLAPGVARLKRGGGNGGHNGLRDLVRALGGERHFARLRLGVGHPGDAQAVLSWVLARPPAGERDALARAIEHALACVPELVAGEWQRAVTRLHSRPKIPSSTSSPEG